MSLDKRIWLRNSSMLERASRGHGPFSFCMTIGTSRPRKVITFTLCFAAMAARQAGHTTYTIIRALMNPEAHLW